MAFGFGGSKNKSSSSSKSESIDFGEDYSYTYMDPQQRENQLALQGGFLDTLGAWQGGGAQQFQQGMQGFTDMATSFAGGQFDLPRAPGVGGGMPSMRGSDEYLKQLSTFAQEGNPYLQEQISQFGEDIDSQFGRMQNRLGGVAARAGQRGSSRQGIAEGMALDSSLSQYQRGVTGMRSADLQRRQQAAAQAAGIEGQRFGSAQSAAAQRSAAAAAARASMYGAQLNAQTQARQQQLTALGLGMQGLQAGQQAMFNPFQIGAGVIGDPTVLQENYGYKFGQSKSESSSKGKGSSANFGF